MYFAWCAYYLCYYFYHLSFLTPFLALIFLSDLPFLDLGLMPVVEDGFLNLVFVLLLVGIVLIL